MIGTEQSKWRPDILHLQRRNDLLDHAFLTCRRKSEFALNSGIPDLIYLEKPSYCRLYGPHAIVLGLSKEFFSCKLIAFGMVQEEKNLYRSAHAMLEHERHTIQFMDEGIFELDYLGNSLSNYVFVFRPGQS